MRTIPEVSTIASLATVLWWSALACAQSPNTNIQLQMLPVQGNTYLLAGANNARVEGDQALKIIGHQNVLNRMTTPAGKETPPPPQFGLPQDEYATAFKDLRLNGEAIGIYHEAKAHTDGDSSVFFVDRTSLVPVISLRPAAIPLSNRARRRDQRRNRRVGPYPGSHGSG